MKAWPSSWPSKIQNPFPSSPLSSGPYRPLPGTTPFWNVYSKVTKKLRDFTMLSRDPNIEEFLEFLIGGFYAEYEDWYKPKPAHGYFTLFRRARFKSLSLVAHAYFHMGYDLPRTIADAFTALPSLNILARGRNDARKTFLQLNNVFPEVFAEESRSYSTNGIFGIIGKVIPLSITKIPAYWVIQMRTVAWINAEMLADEPDVKKKQQIEKEILNCVVKGGKALEREKWNPILWLTVLPAPTVTAVAAYLQFPDVESVAPWVALVLAALLLVSAYLVFAYRGLERISHELGREITRNLEEFLPPAYRERLAFIRREEDAGISR
jgi:hypothetical protein